MCNAHVVLAAYRPAAVPTQYDTAAACKCVVLYQLPGVLRQLSHAAYQPPELLIFSQPNCSSFLLSCHALPCPALPCHPPSRHTRGRDVEAWEWSLNHTLQLTIPLPLFQYFSLKMAPRQKARFERYFASQHPYCYVPVAR